MNMFDYALGAFLPHGYCYLREPGLLSLHVGSDALIALAYFLISFALVFFVLNRRHFQFRTVILFFSAFIMACGMTHAMEIWTVWNASFWLAAWVKFVTAVISLVAAAILIPAIPKALSLRSPEEFDVLDNSLVGIMIVNADKEIVWTNHALQNYFGIAKTDLVGQHRLQLLEQRLKWIFDNADEYAEHVRAAYLNNAEATPIECHIPATAERQERWLEHRSQPIQSGLYEGGRIEQFYDITERIQLFKALGQAQKMETLGQLTGGVAHDFNNLLTIIIGNLQILEDEIHDRTESQQLVKGVLKAALRGAGLTHKLLAFARRQPLKPKIIDLNLQVQNVLTLLERILGEHIIIHTGLCEGLWNAVADPGELETVLVNLAVNARDAMPDGGQLLFETSSESLDVDDFSEPTDAMPGDYVAVSVSDTGCGMSKETLQRVFEPFFTTKPSGKGSGLGLSMVYGFAKQSGGQVRIYSEPGTGTIVKLFLPKAESNSANRAYTARSTEIPKGNHETVLVVEDDQAVREMAVRMLSELGYQTLEAENAEIALRAVSEAGDQIQVLFTDVVLNSDMNGSDLAEKIQQTCPNMRVLYTSGYAEQFAILGNDLKSNIELLSKPYSKKHLAGKLRAVLDNNQ